MVFARMDNAIVITLGLEKGVLCPCVPTIVVRMAFVLMGCVNVTMVGWDMTAQRSLAQATHWWDHIHILVAQVMASVLMGSAIATLVGKVVGVRSHHALSIAVTTVGAVKVNVGAFPDGEVTKEIAVSLHACTIAPDMEYVKMMTHVLATLVTPVWIALWVHALLDALVMVFAIKASAIASQDGMVVSATNKFALPTATSMASAFTRKESTGVIVTLDGAILIAHGASIATRLLGLHVRAMGSA